MKAIAVLTVLCTVTLQCAANAGNPSLAIAERGKASGYSIVVQAKAPPAQAYAAEELRDFTEKVAGVRLPIVTNATGATLPAKAIVLESGRSAKDGFCLKVEGNRLRIIGGNGRGTLYVPGCTGVFP